MPYDVSPVIAEARAVSLVVVFSYDLLRALRGGGFSDVLVRFDCDHWHHVRDARMPVPRSKQCWMAREIS